MCACVCVSAYEHMYMSSCIGFHSRRNMLAEDPVGWAYGVFFHCEEVTVEDLTSPQLE